MESRQCQPASQETRLIVVSAMLLLYSTRMVTLIVGIVNEGDKNQPLAYSKLVRGYHLKAEDLSQTLRDDLPLMVKAA